MSNAAGDALSRADGRGPRDQRLPRRRPAFGGESVGDIPLPARAFRLGDTGARPWNGGGRRPEIEWMTWAPPSRLPLVEPSSSRLRSCRRGWAGSEAYGMRQDWCRRSGLDGSSDGVLACPGLACRRPSPFATSPTPSRSHYTLTGASESMMPPRSWRGSSPSASWSILSDRASSS